MESKKNDVGVVIGRFQPFHLGHAWLIKESLRKFEKLIILVGSSNIKDRNNLWDLKTRIKMLEDFISHENVGDRIIKIEEIEDVPSDDNWLEIALSKIGLRNFTVIGDNDWVNSIFSEAGYSIYRIGYKNRDLWEGKRIRKLLIEDNNWQERVPEYLVELIRS